MLKVCLAIGTEAKSLDMIEGKVDAMEGSIKAVEGKMDAVEDKVEEMKGYDDATDADD